MSPWPPLLIVAAAFTLVGTVVDVGGQIVRIGRDSGR
jgi:hypothetical protein